MRRRWDHTHECALCGKDRVACSMLPEREEDGYACPGEAHPDQYVCEDCLDLEMCEMCGTWLPAATLVDKGMCLMCPNCLEAEPDE
jgi:hypothetical protein